MKTILMFRMPFSTKLFNLNQKIWIRRGTGALAAEVRGRFRGRGKYITAWVNWNTKSKAAPTIKKIEVVEKFYNKIRQGCDCNEWYENFIR